MPHKASVFVLCSQPWQIRTPCHRCPRGLCVRAVHQAPRVFGLLVGGSSATQQLNAARACRYKVDYPDLYATSENCGDKDAIRAFNCVQRAHQNSLEHEGVFLALLIAGGLAVRLASFLSSCSPYAVSWGSSACVRCNRMREAAVRARTNAPLPALCGGALRETSRGALYSYELRAAPRNTWRSSGARTAAL